MSDQPLQTEEELTTMEFGHKDIGKTLVNMICKCPTPFTIGLFGKWGSGKSTIVNSLKKDLLPKKIPVVIFDVWKHEGDALRRTFLKDMCKQLENYGKNFFNKHKLNDELDNNVSKTSDSKTSISYNKVRNLAILWIICAIILLISTIFGTKYDLNFDLLDGFSMSTFIIIIVFFIVWLMQNANVVLSTRTETKNKNRFEDPCEFEDEFLKIINNLKNKRILIVFDNVDRVTPDKVMNLFVTIKTFLEVKDKNKINKEIIVLIPCDNHAIKKQIEKIYETDKCKSVYTSDEFLRKIFNTVVCIPDFISSELEVYTKQKLKETKVGELDNDNVAWFITKTFRQNPRQIKQFINILLSNYLLIKEREGIGLDFPIGFISNNISQLTKYLILVQIYPDEMNLLREEKIVNLEKVNFEKIEQLDNINTKYKFIKFLNETKLNIPIENLRIFFTLRRSEQEKKIPGVQTFFDFLDDNNISEAEKYLIQLENLSEKIDDFSHVIKTELEHKINLVSISTFINSLLIVLDKLNIELLSTVYSDIYNKLMSVENKENLQKISPLALNRQLIIKCPHYKKQIIESWLTILNDKNREKLKIQFTDEYLKEVFEIFIENSNYLTIKQSDKFRMILSSRYTEPIWIPKLFVNSGPDIQKKYLNSTYLDNYISNITTSDIDNSFLNSDEDDRFSEKIKILIKFNIDFFDRDILNIIINKLIKLQSYENNKSVKLNNYESKKRLIDNSILIIKKLCDALKTEEAKIFNMFGTTSSTEYIELLIQASNSLSNWDERKLFIPVFLTLEKIVDESNCLLLENQIVDFFTSATQESINYVFAYVSIEDVFETLNYYDIFKKRAFENQDFFNKYYNQISDIKKTEWLISLLDINSTRAIEMIKVLDYKVPESKKIVEKILGVLDGKAIAVQKDLLTICNCFRCGGDSELRNRFIDYVKKLIKLNDNNSSPMGLKIFLDSKKYIGKKRIRIFAKELFDFIGKPEITNKYQPDLLNAIYEGYDYFNKEEKNNFLQFIFDEIIRKTMTIESIQFGFELLKKIKPTYEDRKENYDDIKNRIEQDSGNSIHIELIKGLFELTPIKNDKGQNRDYWTWVDKQQRFI